MFFLDPIERQLPCKCIDDGEVKLWAEFYIVILVLILGYGLLEVIKKQLDKFF